MPDTAAAPTPDVRDPYAVQHALMLRGLSDEIAAVEAGLKAWGGDRPVGVLSATLEGSEGEVYLYTVMVDREIHPPEYASVEVSTGAGTVVRGAVEALDPDGRTMTLALDDLVRGEWKGAQIAFSPTAILKATRLMLEGLGPAAPVAPRYLSSIRAVLGLDPVRAHAHGQDHPVLARSPLNASQRVAVARCAGSPLQLVYGPPGTGKTSTLGPLVALGAEGLQERVLVVTHTNTALDRALAAVIEAIDPALVASGRVLRLGRPGPELDAHPVSLREVTRRQRRGGAGALSATAEPLTDELARATSALATLAPQHSPEASQLRVLSHTPVRDANRRLVQLLGLAGRLTTLVAGTSGAPAVERLLALLHEVAEAERAASATVMQGARVLGLTFSKLALTGAASLGAFDRVVIDEGSMAMLPQVVLAASLAARVAVFGDPRQLPPVVMARTRDAAAALSRDVFTHLGLTDPTRADDRQSVLTVQYRMAPPIRRVVSTVFYGGLLTDGEGVADREESPGPRVVLLDTSDTEAASVRTGKSWVNETHVEMVTRLVQELRAGGETDIGIITPFAPQQRRIRSDVHATVPRFLREGFVRTIHRSQGGEKPVIILDFVDAGRGRDISGFLDERITRDLPRLLCVAASRARSRLVVLAHTQGFRERYGRRGTLIRLLGECARAGTYHRLGAEWRSSPLLPPSSLALPDAGLRVEASGPASVAPSSPSLGPALVAGPRR